MPSDYFLDSLCQYGFAQKKDIIVKESRPSFPNQNRELTGTSFHHQKLTQYTIGLGIAKIDKTRVVIPMLKASRPVDSQSTITILEKLLAWLEKAGTIQDGIPFTSSISGGSGPCYYAKHTEEPVNVDLLMAIAGLVGPGPGETKLDLAYAINNIKDLISEMKQNEAEYQKKQNEIFANSSKDSSWINKYLNTKDEYEKKLKELLEQNVKEIENKRSGDPKVMKNNKAPNQAKSEPTTYTPFITKKQKIDIDSITTVNIEITIFNYNDYVSVNNKTGYYKKGDTISIIKNVYIKGIYAYDGGSIWYQH